MFTLNMNILTSFKGSQTLELNFLKILKNAARINIIALCRRYIKSFCDRIHYDRLGNGLYQMHGMRISNTESMQQKCHKLHKRVTDLRLHMCLYFLMIRFALYMLEAAAASNTSI